MTKIKDMSKAQKKRLMKSKRWKDMERTVQRAAEDGDRKPGRRR